MRIRVPVPPAMTAAPRVALSLTVGSFASPGGATIPWPLLSAFSGRTCRGFGAVAACWWRPAPTICAASCYGYRWRHVIRPRILERAAARLEVAHLDRTPSHDTDDNLMAWCCAATRNTIAASYPTAWSAAICGTRRYSSHQASAIGGAPDRRNPLPQRAEMCRAPGSAFHQGLERRCS